MSLRSDSVGPSDSAGPSEPAGLSQPPSPTAQAQLPLHIVEGTLLRPVRPGNALEETVSRLLQSIRLGVIAPGRQLPPERELAAMLDVSRDTVRDAIRELRGAGYLIAHRGRYGGTFVAETLPQTGLRQATVPQPTPPTATDITDVLVLREILEVGAVRQAATSPLTPGERAELRARLNAVTRASPTDYRRLDSRFHLMFGELSGAPTLVSLLADSRTRVNALLDRIPLLERNIVHSNQQHERIVSAILAGDADAAADAMTEHLAGTAALLRGFLS